MFLQPMSTISLGPQPLLLRHGAVESDLGLAQPSSCLADKKGAGRVVAVSGLLYAAAYTDAVFTTPLMLDASAD